MGKYNIIKKCPEGNKIHKNYIVKYQVNNNPEIYEVEMFCINYEGEIRYAFIEESKNVLRGKNPIHINTLEDREEFVQEIKKYQAGSSYRKTHPIIYSEKDQLLNKIKELQNQVSQIEQKEYNDKINNYKNKIKLIENDKEYNKLKSNLEKSTKKYKLSYVEFGSTTRLCIMDKENNLPISYFILGKFEPLDEIDIKLLIK